MKILKRVQASSASKGADAYSIVRSFLEGWKGAKSVSGGENSMGLWQRYTFDPAVRMTEMDMDRLEADLNSAGYILTKLGDEALGRIRLIEVLIPTRKEEHLEMDGEEVAWILEQLQDAGALQDLSRQAGGDEDDYFELENINDVGNGWIKFDIYGYNDNTHNDYTAKMKFNVDTSDYVIL